MNKYEQAYKLDTEEGVTAFLNDYTKLVEARFWANDFSISDLLIDFETALPKAVTPRQQEILSLMFFNDLKQSEVAKLVNLTQQTVQEHIQRGIKNLAEYHRREKERGEWD